MPNAEVGHRYGSVQANLTDYVTLRERFCQEPEPGQAPRRFPCRSISGYPTMDSRSASGSDAEARPATPGGVDAVTALPPGPLPTVTVGAVHEHRYEGLRHFGLDGNSTCLPQPQRVQPAGRSAKITMARTSAGPARRERQRPGSG